MKLAEKTEEKSEDVEFRLRRFYIYNKRNRKKRRQFKKKINGNLIKHGKW